MKRLRALAAAALLAAAMSATLGSASAAPTLYCGYGLDRVCRIICPKCAFQATTPVRAAAFGR